MLRFASSSLTNIPNKEKRKEVPLLAVHLPKSRTKAKTRISQIINYLVREKGMENKGKLW